MVASAPPSDSVIDEYEHLDHPKMGLVVTKWSGHPLSGTTTHTSRFRSGTTDNFIYALEFLATRVMQTF